MMYTRTKEMIQRSFDGIQRAYDVREKETLSDAWLLELLNKA